MFLDLDEIDNDLLLLTNIELLLFSLLELEYSSFD